MRSEMAAAGNGDGATAILAEDLSKHYQLGELHSLQQTLNQLTRRSRSEEVPSIEALRSGNFRVRRGESFWLVGTSGSGKSTGLQILAGTTLPTGGALTVEG